MSQIFTQGDKVYLNLAKCECGAGGSDTLDIFENLGLDFEQYGIVKAPGILFTTVSFTICDGYEEKCEEEKISIPTRFLNKVKGKDGHSKVKSRHNHPLTSMFVEQNQ